MKTLYISNPIFAAYLAMTGNVPDLQPDGTTHFKIGNTLIIVKTT